MQALAAQGLGGEFSGGSALRRCGHSGCPRLHPSLHQIHRLGLVAAGGRRGSSASFTRSSSFVPASARRQACRSCSGVGGKPASAAAVLWECCPPGGLPDIVVSHRHHEVLHESVELLGHNSHRRGDDTIDRHRLGSARRLLARAVIRKLTVAPELCGPSNASEATESYITTTLVLPSASRPATN